MNVTNVSAKLMLMFKNINANGLEKMYKLRPNLWCNSDYQMVPERVFNELCAAYGVEMADRDVMMRTVLHKYNHFQMYPYTVKVLLLFFFKNFFKHNFWLVQKPK